MFSLVFLLGGSTMDGYSSSVELNSTDISEPEIDTGGLFSSGVSFGRFFTLITAGIGLPDDTPAWFGIMFSAWQIIINILAVGFIISSIWDG